MGKGKKDEGETKPVDDPNVIRQGYLKRMKVRHFLICNRRRCPKSLYSVHMGPRTQSSLQSSFVLHVGAPCHGAPSTKEDSLAWPTRGGAHGRARDTEHLHEGGLGTRLLYSYSYESTVLTNCGTPAI